jgi:hypothetical protein
MTRTPGRDSTSGGDGSHFLVPIVCASNEVFLDHPLFPFCFSWYSQKLDSTILQHTQTHTQILSLTQNYPKTMKLLATSALFAIMTMILVPSTPVMATTYTCPVTGSFEYQHTSSTLTSAQKSYALSRIKSSYLAVHQANYPGYSVPSSPTATSWTIRKLSSMIVYWNQLTGQFTSEAIEQPQQEAQLRGSAEVQQYGIWYGSYIRFGFGIRCTACGGSTGDDDTIPGVLAVTVDEAALEHLSVQANIDRWELAWCDELTQNPAYPMYLRSRKCNLVFNSATCTIVAEDGEVDEDMMEIVTVTVNDNDVEETLDTLDAGEAAAMAATVA